MDRSAAFLDAGRDLEATLRHVAFADVLGYEAVYDNHVLGRDGLGTLAHYATVSSNTRLGTGVYPAFTTSPLALAQLAATLDEFTGGRLVLGLGTSHRQVIEGFHGLDFPDAPVGRMRETIEVVRTLFREGRVDHDGDHHQVHFTFRTFQPRPDIRIELAALGPQMLRLAGELADGVLLWLCDDRYVREVVVPNVAEGARRAGRDPAEIDIVPAVTCGLVTDDPGPARDKYRRILSGYLTLPFYRSMLADSGWGEVLDDVDAARERGDADAARAAIVDDMVDSLTGIGSAETVRAALQRYREAGATLPAVGPLTAEGCASADQVLLAASGRRAATS